MASETKYSTPAVFTGTGLGVSSTSGSTALFAMANAEVSLYLAGTFTATFQVVAVPKGGAMANAVPLTPIAAASPNCSAPGIYQYPFLGGDYTYGILCTAFTSAPAAGSVALSAGPRA